MNIEVHHSFNINLAARLGSVDLAILVHHFAFWIDKNKRAKRNFHEGKYWMYQSLEEIALTFPYWSRDQVNRYIRKLVKLEILVKGNHNKTSFDRTVWYAFHDEFAKSSWRNRQMDMAESPNQSGGIATPIPDTKTDAKTNKKDMSQQRPSPQLRLATLLFEKIKEINPKAKKPNLETWAKDIEKLMRLDNRTEKETEAVINWVANNDFWCKNILSGKKLREKFDQLYVNMIKHKESPKKKEEDEAKQKVDRIKANKEWAQIFLEGKTFNNTNHLRLKDNGVEAFLFGAYRIVGFLEHGFQDQVESIFRKITDREGW